MPIPRTWYDTLVEDTGFGLDGSIWDKADVLALLDAVDLVLAGGATPTSVAALIGQGVSTKVSNLFDVTAPVTGPHFGAAFQIVGFSSGTSYKVALYGAAQTGAGGDDIYGANFVAQRNAGATDSNVIAAEINLNNNDADVALNETPLVVGLNITGGGTKHMRSAIYANAIGTGKFRKGIEFVAGSVLSTGIEIGTTVGLSGTALFRQLEAGGQTLLLQRFTDTTPTGNFVSMVNQANNAELFNVAMDGSMYAAMQGGASCKFGTTIQISSFASTLASIASLELLYSAAGGYGAVQAYDRSNSTWKTLLAQGLTVGLCPSGTERARVDGNTTAAETALLLTVAGGSLVRVSVGAADSGGTGFKYLRVPN